MKTLKKGIKVRFRFSGNIHSGIILSIDDDQIQIKPSIKDRVAFGGINGMKPIINIKDII